MTSPAPTDAELRRAYARAELARVGISYQRALETPHLRTALTDSAQATRRKAEASALPVDAAANAAKPKSTPRQQCYLSMQFQVQED